MACDRITARRRGSHATTSVALAVAAALLSGATPASAEHTSTFLGCFIDLPHSRDLVGETSYSATATASVSLCGEWCANYARGAPYRYFGVQSGWRCFCDNTYGTYGEGSFRDCRPLPCKANPAQSCGGVRSNDIYRITSRSGPTEAPPTPAPNTTAPDTSAPPTPAPNTTVPDTAAPATPAPPTGAPPPATESPSSPSPPDDTTATPRRDAAAAPVPTKAAVAMPQRQQQQQQPPRLPPPIFPSRVQRGLAGAAVVAGAISSGGAFFAPLRIALLGQGCSPPDTALPAVLHPTGLVVHGSEPLGMLLGNAAAAASLCLASLLLLTFARAWGAEVCPTACRLLDSFGLLRLPSTAALAGCLLYQSASLAAFALLHFPQAVAEVAVGLAALVVCLILPWCLVRSLIRGAPGSAVYVTVEGRCRENTPARLAQVALGRGEWVNLQPGSLWVQRNACAIRDYAPGGGACFLAVEFATSFALSGVFAAAVKSPEGCAHRFSAAAVITLVHLGATFAMRSPFAKPRDLAACVATSVLQLSSTLLTAYSLYITASETGPSQVEDTTTAAAATATPTTLGVWPERLPPGIPLASQLLSAACVLCILKSVADALCGAYLAWSGSRYCLQDDVYALVDAGVILRGAQSEGGDDMDDSGGEGDVESEGKPRAASSASSRRSRCGSEKKAGLENGVSEGVGKRKRRNLALASLGAGNPPAPVEGGKAVGRKKKLQQMQQRRAPQDLDIVCVASEGSGDDSSSPAGEMSYSTMGTAVTIEVATPRGSRGFPSLDASSGPSSFRAPRRAASGIVRGTCRFGRAGSSGQLAGGIPPLWSGGDSDRGKSLSLRATAAAAPGGFARGAPAATPPERSFGSPPRPQLARSNTASVLGSHRVPQRRLQRVGSGSGRFDHAELSVVSAAPRPRWGRNAPDAQLPAGCSDALNSSGVFPPGEVVAPVEI